MGRITSNITLVKEKTIKAILNIQGLSYNYGFQVQNKCLEYLLCVLILNDELVMRGILDFTRGSDPIIIIGVRSAAFLACYSAGSYSTAGTYRFTRAFPCQMLQICSSSAGWA